MTQLSDYLNEVRSALEDWGDTITDNATGDGVTTLWKLSSFPIKSGSDTGNFTNAGTVQVITTNYTINYNTGEVTYVTAPTNGNALVFKYTKVVWPDDRLISGINAGIREMVKDYAYKIGQIYVQLQTNKWEYDMTSVVDVPPVSSFGDQTIPADYNPATARADAIKATTAFKVYDYRPFGPNNQFVPYDFVRRTTPRNIQIDGNPTTSATIRITYTAPFTVLVNPSDVTDVPDELYMAPVWYALSTVLEKKEARRARFDSYTVAQGPQASPPGTQAQTADDFLVRYKELMTGAMRPFRMRSRRSMRSWELSGRF